MECCRCEAGFMGGAAAGWKLGSGHPGLPGGAEARKGVWKSQTKPCKRRAHKGFAQWRPGALTPSPTFGYLSKLVFERMTPMDRAGRNGTDIQAAEPEARQQARLSGTEQDESRAQDAGTPAPARKGAPGRDRRREVATGAHAAGESLPRTARVRLGSEIRALLQRGKRKRTPNVDVFFAPSPASRSRLGLIVPKHGRTIVERNRVKRRLREIGRREVLPMLADRATPGDVLLRARRAAYGATFEELRRDVLEGVRSLW